MTATGKPRYTIDIEAPANGRIGKATVTVRDADGKTRASDRADLSSASERKRLAGRLAADLGDVDAAELKALIDARWLELLDRRQRVREQMAAGSPEAVAVETVQLLDAAPPAICRPLCLIDGQSYAAAWLTVQRTVTRSVDPHAGTVADHDPPLVQAEAVRLIVRGDGRLFADAALPDARRLAELGLEVRLPSPLPPRREWSGAGVKRYLAGERPEPAEVFGRVVSVVDRFLDFSRSLAAQETMCELVACYVLSTYFLGALNVVGYLWPNGERGAGKTTFLHVVAELAYLGQVILAGSSYACLRDLADYGATLCFDDAEAVMDRRADPDKRALLLAGNRRGATIAVKELEGDRWVTRQVDTFCPRLFSAIRLPDEVLGSRTIVAPLVRSGDPRRAKASPLDPEDWPCDRRQLVDDLWALGLAHLPEIPRYERLAASAADLCGRSLEPWRGILAIAAWLEERHGLADLFRRMERLSRDYEQERGEIEGEDRTRVLLRALLRLSAGWVAGVPQTVHPKAVADAMNEIAEAEDMAEGEKAFTSPRRVGWLLKRQRFRRPKGRSEKGKLWEMTRQEVEAACRTYGIDPAEEESAPEVPL